jgi:polar amino acid transport system substrate-binding protein
MKKTNKLLSFIMVLLLMLTVVACGSNSDTQPATGVNDGTGSVAENTDTETKGDSIVDQIKAKGTLVVGTSADYPPYEFHVMLNGKDEIVGFDIDIARAIADDLGVELVLRDMDFDGLLAALTTGVVDMVIAGMTPTPERAESVDFSMIYYTATHGVLVQAGNEESINVFEDLEGKAVGVQQASIQAEIAEGINNPKEIRTVPRITDLVLMLQTGRVDAVIMELPVASAYVRKNDKLALTSLELVDDEGGAAVAVRKNNPEFIEIINNTLEKLIEEDKISEFFNAAIELEESQN